LGDIESATRALPDWLGVVLIIVLAVIIVIVRSNLYRVKEDAFRLPKIKRDWKDKK
jgi:hypothetical protein